MMKKICMYMGAFLLLFPFSLMHASKIDFENLGTHVQKLLTPDPMDDADAIEEKKVKAREVLHDAMVAAQESEDEDLQKMAPLYYLESLTLGKPIDDQQTQGAVVGGVKPIDFKELRDLAKSAEPFHCVLSIDGGGIRGLIPALYLQWIEEETGLPASSLFDFFAGTSVGGILSLGVTCPDPKDPNNRKFPAKTFVDLFEKEGEQIFPPKSKNFLAKYLNSAGELLLYTAFSPKPLEKKLKEYFNDTELRHALKPVMVTSIDTTCKKSAGREFLFTREEAKDKNDENFYFRDVARATSAASTYFPPAKIYPVRGGHRKVFVDAGLTLNNPVLLAYRTFKHLLPKDDKVIVFSFGTGRPNSMDSIPHGGGAAFHAKPLIDNMMTMSSDRGDFDMQQTISLMKGDAYFRVQVDLDQKVGLSDVGEDNITYLKDQAQRQYDNIMEIARFLKANHSKK